MVRTRVGYAGGKHANPTYHDLGDHSEAIQVEFDPAVISYAELLRQFWSGHNPCGSSYTSQYRAILFYHDEAQHQLAVATSLAAANVAGRGLTTAIVPFTSFWLAEDYHQKYALRNARRIAADLERVYPTAAAFRDATATARLNAYCDGELDYPKLRRELGRLGLVAVGEQQLQGVVVK